MKKIIGTNEKPRISIFRSNRFISGQAIDDAKGATISSATTRKLTGNPSTGSTALTTDKLGAGTPIEKAVEAIVAELAKMAKPIKGKIGLEGKVIVESESIYLRLQKKGENLNAFYSKDGSGWIDIGQATINFPYTVNIGLFSAS